jgi:hypothetical protein
MKIGCLLCLIIFLSIVPLTAIADSGADLDVEVNGVWSKNIIVNRNFRIIIKNIGDETALETKCDIKVIGGILPITRSDWSLNVGDIKPDTTRVVPFHDFFLPRFGVIEMIAQVQAENTEMVMESVNAFAFGFIWFIH